jgi:F-type H+-transporting ATPase subunit b
MVAPTLINACELKNKLQLLLVVSLLATVSPAFAQQPDHSQPTTEQAAPGIQAEPNEHASDEEHHSVWAGLLWPTVNFAILFGGLWYFLKAPLATYLRDRHTAIRKDLVEAANVSAAAQAQLAEIDRKLKALPAEIEALRQRGGEEIAAEEARIAQAAAAERERLLEQTRREIDVQLRLAKRALVEHTADLAVQLASGRIQQQMTPTDQERLVDRYLTDVKTDRAGGAR